MLIADSLGYRVDSLSVIPTVITLLSETESKPNSQKTKAFHSWKTGVSLTRCQKSAALLRTPYTPESTPYTPQPPPIIPITPPKSLPHPLQFLGPHPLPNSPFPHPNEGTPPLPPPSPPRSPSKQTKTRSRVVYRRTPTSRVSDWTRMERRLPSIQASWDRRRRAR